MAIRLVELGGSSPVTLPLEKAYFYNPTWAPDGAALAVVWYDGSTTELYRVALDDFQMVPLAPKGIGAREGSWFVR